MNLAIHGVYTHKRNMMKYRVIMLGLMKQGDGEWVPSVIYHATADPGQIFTRDEKMFRQNFEEVGHHD